MTGVAVVTGAASGIGLATARRLGSRGLTIVAVDRRLEELADGVRRLEVDGVSAMVHHADLADPVACEAIVRTTDAQLGRIDVLVNCAAAGTQEVGGTVESIDIERWQLTQDVNLRAIYLLCRYAVPIMRRGGGGAVVNVSSAAALRSRANRASHAYAASKAGVLALTRAMAVSYGGDGIRVNAVLPGAIRTRLTEDVIDVIAERAAQGIGIPLRRVGEPDDVARVIDFLASDAAAYVTGIELLVDGGAFAMA